MINTIIFIILLIYILVSIFGFLFVFKKISETKNNILELENKIKELNDSLVSIDNKTNNKIESLNKSFFNNSLQNKVNTLSLEINKIKAVIETFNNGFVPIQSYFNQ